MEWLLIRASVSFCPMRELHLVGQCCKLLLQPLYLAHLTVISEHSVELLCDSDEGGPAAQLLQFSSSDIGARRADTTQDVSYRILYWPFIEDLNRLAFRCPGDKKKES